MIGVILMYMFNISVVLLILSAAFVRETNKYYKIGRVVAKNVEANTQYYLHVLHIDTTYKIKVNFSVYDKYSEGDEFPIKI